MTPDTLPPHDLAAEAAAIGSVMLADAPLQRRLLTTLSPAHFFLPEHGQIWAAIAAVAGRRDAVDPLTVRMELKDRGQLEAIGGTLAIADVLESVPSAANGENYAAAVLHHARRRALYRITAETSTEVWEHGSDAVAIAYRLRDRLEALLRRATSPTHREGGADEVAAVLDAEAAGRRAAASMPWPVLGRLTRCLLPGSITLLVGDPGAGKTFWLLEALNHWTTAGVPTALLALEKDRAWHLRRCLALLTKDLRTLDDEAVRDRATWYTSRPGEHRETLDALGRCVWDSTHTGSTLADLAAWVDQRADSGDRIIVVDPVSLADTDARPWEAHDVFMRAVRRSLERTGASLILATHPRGGQKNGPPTIDDLAGSRVFVRRADAILWLRGCGTRQATCIPYVAMEATRTTCDIDRTVRVLKCRDGSASGFDFGFQWHRTAGGFIERGIVEAWLTEGAIDEVP